jgi:2-dehydro-3-deoxyglucarate aldolase
MNLKMRLRKKELTLGSWITIGDCSCVEIMAKSGFDWLAIDMEHSAIEISKAQDLVRIIELCGCASFIRVGENNPNIIKRAMDTGISGVIVPMVNTKEDAVKAVNAVKYPPVGTRGVGLGRAQGYGLEFEKYKNSVNKNSIVIVQIEHIQAVENLEDILKVKGVDGFIVGPYDLSASLGVPGEFNNFKVKDAMQRVISVSKKMNVLAGFHVIPPDFKEVIKKCELGYRFIAFSLDSLFLGKSCLEGLRNIKESLK